MIRHFDHFTILVRELEKAKRFFAAFGLVEERAVVISGETMSAYFGLADVEADHVTLVLPGSDPRLEVQLLRFHRPTPVEDRESGRLDRTGFNHIAFVVDDIDGQTAKLRAEGVSLLNRPLEFHDRRLVFVRGPEGVVVEMVQWLRASPTS